MQSLQALPRALTQLLLHNCYQLVKIRCAMSILAMLFCTYRVPYELRICTKCNWRCVQDEEHVLLNCPSADLAELRIKHHHLFHTRYPL